MWGCCAAELPKEVLLGKDGTSLVSAVEIARHVGTVPYEIICGVRATVERGDREVVG